MKNTQKYDSYKEAFKLMKQAVDNQELPTSIAAIAITESIIADRCYSFLHYKENRFIMEKKSRNEFIKTSVLVDRCGKYFKNHPEKVNQKDGNVLSTTSLFPEVKEWLKKRNSCLHGFAKSEPKTPTMSVDDFKRFAIETSKEGYKYATLIKKWHKNELEKNRKLGISL